MGFEKFSYPLLGVRFPRPTNRFCAPPRRRPEGGMKIFQIPRFCGVFIPPSGCRFSLASRPFFGRGKRTPRRGYENFRISYPTTSTKCRGGEICPAPFCRRRPETPTQKRPTARIIAPRHELSQLELFALKWPNPGTSPCKYGSALPKPAAKFGRSIG